jgi:integrase/recombinase XerC
LDRSQVRRLLLEIELRQDIRAAAIFCLFLYSGARVSDLINLQLIRESATISRLDLEFRQR